MATSNFNQYEYYESGTTYTIDEYLGGYIADSSKSINFTLSMAKWMNGASITLSTLHLRTVDGRINVDLVNNLSSVSVLIRENTLKVQVMLTTAIAATTNTPVGINVVGTVTFS